jgi:predicted lipoprotein with Yx(FWY)xxD motif
VAQPPAGSGPVLEPRRTALGLILTDGRGFTLYAFGADRDATPRCTGLRAGRQEEPGEAGPVPGSQAPHQEAGARP